MEKGIATCIRHASPGFEHVVVCLTRSGASAALLPPGIPVVELHKPPGNSPRFLLRLVRALRELEPDVVHTRNWGGLDGILGAHLGGLRRVLHGDHGWEVEDLAGGPPRRRWVRRVLSGLTGGFTCVSRDLRRWLLEEVGVRCPVTQIYNGVDTAVYRPGADGAEVRRELGLPADVPVVGHVGRLVEIKDHATLFRAFDRVRRELPDAVLLCVGDGPLRETLQRSAGEGVRLLGHRDDTARVLRALDVFVLCSLREGISNTILEAMAGGLPVVATRVGGNPELVTEGSTGALVPAADADGLAGALTRYLGDPVLRRAHGAAARETALQRFGVAGMVGAYESAWRSVAAEGRLPG